MQPPQGPFRLGPDHPDGSDEQEGQEGQPASIRDIQRRRRDEARMRADIQAILGEPEEDEDEEGEPRPAASGPVPARVFLVFRAARWEDPNGGLRESDTIAGVYRTEEAARTAVALLNKHDHDGDAWYQPYTVQD